MYSVTIHSASSITDDWKTEVEGLITKYASLPRPVIAKTVCQYMYQHHPDITWVVLIYEPITGFDAHAMTYRSSTQILFRYHGHNVVVTRYDGDVVESGNDLELDLLASFTPTCYTYCHDPACWNTYHHVDCGKTCNATWEKLAKLKYLELLHVLQGRFEISNYAGRQDSSTGKIKAGTVSGTCQWDRRVVQKDIAASSCGDDGAKVMVLGS